MGHSDKGDPSVPLPAAGDNPEDGTKNATKDGTRDGTRQPGEPGVKAANDCADSAPDVERRKKINDLKQAVSDGTYHVSPEEVARKIIEHMLEPKG
jgi:anti-sigma28 factor (negative regulator of flagellin synthesis)